MNALFRGPYPGWLIIGTIAPALLLTSAMSMQRILHLVPCHMCMQQRTALMTGMLLAMVGLIVHDAIAGRILAVASAASIGSSAWVAIKQLGGERRWWVLDMPCTSAMPKGGSALENIMNTPIVRCDVPQWSYAGMTMADLNAVACITTTLAMLALMMRNERRRSETKALQLQNSEEK